MDHLAVEKCVAIIEFYYKNTDSTMYRQWGICEPMT